jgi:NADH-quinone oxidoreductase subunit E
MSIENILKSFPPDPSFLLTILHKLQDSHPQQYLSREAIQKTAGYLNISLASVYGTIGYYSMFSTRPRNKNLIRVCQSPVCRMYGSKELQQILEEKAGIDTVVEECECLGECDKAPVLLKNRKIYGNLSSAKALKLVGKTKKDGKR